jgi:transcriptional regulator with XRE-family HTH domain
MPEENKPSIRPKLTRSQRRRWKRLRALARNDSERLFVNLVFYDRMPMARVASLLGMTKLRALEIRDSLMLRDRSEIESKIRADVQRVERIQEARKLAHRGKRKTRREARLSNRSDLAKFVESVRLGRGLSRQRFGELCGLAGVTVTSIEAGRKNPHRSTLEKIAPVVGRPVSDLLAMRRKGAPEAAEPAPVPGERRNWGNADAKPAAASGEAGGLEALSGGPEPAPCSDRQETAKEGQLTDGPEEQPVH